MKITLNLLALYTQGCRLDDLTLGDGEILYVGASGTLANPNKPALVALGELRIFGAQFWMSE
jgi:hypothetical protein